MTGEPDLAGVASLIGDGSRATMLMALLDRGPMTASALATRAKISRPAASAHLRKLTLGGLLAVQPRGRHRYYRLASEAVADAIAGLLLLAPIRPAQSLRDANEHEALRRGRMCHDHLGGRTGVMLTRGLTEGRLLERRGSALSVTPRGVRAFAALDIDVAALRTHQRPITRACLDWSEHADHLGGALGAAVATELFRRGWLHTREASRIVSVTERGCAELVEHFHLTSCTASPPVPLRRTA